MMREYIIVYFFIISFLISFLVVPKLKRIAFKYDILDHPGHRKIHQNAKPYLGGVAIFLGFMIPIIIHFIILINLPDNLLPENLSKFLLRQQSYLSRVLPKLSAILIGGSLMFTIGFIDDIKGPEFSPRYKFLLQLFVAIFATFMGIRISFMPFEWMNIVISIFWIVGITNSFNLLDNMDGLSSGVAGLSALIFLGITAIQGQFFMAIILIVFIGSILGFLKYNYYPSTIFMGDAGSLFIGYILSTLTIIASYVTKESSSLLPALMPVIILSIPIYDTISVVAIRIKERRPIYVGDKRHLSHRLVDMGFSPRHAVNTIYLLTLAIGFAAFLLPSISIKLSILVLVQVIIILIIISILMFVGKRNKK